MNIIPFLSKIIYDLAELILRLRYWEIQFPSANWYWALTLQIPAYTRISTLALLWRHQNFRGINWAPPVAQIWKYWDQLRGERTLGWPKFPTTDNIRRLEPTLDHTSAAPYIWPPLSVSRRRCAGVRMREGAGFLVHKKQKNVWMFLLRFH